MYVVVSVVTLLLVVGALVDISTRSEWQVKHLPKTVWVLLVVFLPLIGSMLWFLIGREYSKPPGEIFTVRPTASEHPDQWSQAPAASRPESTEKQLLRVEREIEFHEKQARIAQLQADLDRREQRRSKPRPPWRRPRAAWLTTPAPQQRP
jgi:hypothetical protein